MVNSTVLSAECYLKVREQNFKGFESLHQLHHPLSSYATMCIPGLPLGSFTHFHVTNDPLSSGRLQRGRMCPARDPHCGVARGYPKMLLAVPVRCDRQRCKLGSAEAQHGADAVLAVPVFLLTIPAPTNTPSTWTSLTAGVFAFGSHMAKLTRVQHVV